MKNITLGIIFCLLQILFCSALTINAQKNEEILLPIFPLIAEYEYAPNYLWQEIKDDATYSDIIAIFDPKDLNSVEVILEEKGTGKRVYYSNSEAKTAMRKMEGKEAILTKIDFKSSESDKGLPIYGLGLPDKNGKPILWRAIPTSEPSKRGAGLTPLGQREGLQLDYRDVGTTIGEGTAVKIGDKTYEAIPWTEISAPPYFYAYRGSVTFGRHIGNLGLGSEKWSVTSQPNQIKTGENWILTNERGYKRTLKITSDKNNELVIDEVNPQFKHASQLRLVIHTTPKGYNLRAVELNSRSSKMHIKFEPELPIKTTDSAAFEGEFFINQGENKSVVTGLITRKQADNNSISLKWLPRFPIGQSRNLLNL